MDQNPYAAPSLEADAPVAHASSSEALPWFAVGTRKLWVMSLLSVGIYAVYWFERQYRAQKRTNLESTRPVWRAIFSVFYANDLFRRVEGAAARAGVERSWMSSPMVGLFIASAVMGRLLDRVGAKLTTGPTSAAFTLVSLAMVIGLVYPIVQVQGTVNDLLARASPGYDKNERLTAWNWLVMAAGTLFLALATLGLVLPDQETPQVDDPGSDIFQQ